MAQSDPSLVDITHDLATLGLILEYDERGVFVVQSVDAGSPAEKARVVAGDVVTEFNSVALQPVQRAPAVRKHGIRHGKYAFLRIAKDDACVECALERTLSATDGPEHRGPGSGNSSSTSPLNPGAHNTVVKQGAPWSTERAGCMLASVHEDFRAALRDIDAFKPLSVDRNSRPPSAVEKKASQGHRGTTMSSNDTGSHRMGNLRWKKLVSSATPSTTLSPCRRVPSSARVTKERGGAAEINLIQALARIEELSQENDALRGKLEQQHGVVNKAWLEQQLRQGREESQKQLQRTVADFQEREAGYTRQIASLKEELAEAHRRVQEVMGACAEYQIQHEKDFLQPSTAMMRCLEATCLKIFAIRPAFEDQVCRDVYTMMFSWCSEEWTSPTLAQNIAGGTRLVARNEAVKDGLLDCGAMQAMIKIASMFSRNSCDVESMAVEHATASVANLSLKHPRARSVLVQCGGLQVLVKLLAESVKGSAHSFSISPSLLEKACAALSHALCSIDTKNAFVMAGGIPALVKVMSLTKCSHAGFGYERLLAEASRALRNLAHEDTAICRQILSHQGTDVLVEICLTSLEKAVITQAGAALANLACDEACRADLRRKYNYNKDFCKRNLARVSEDPMQANSRARRCSSFVTAPASRPSQSPAASRAAMRPKSSPATPNAKTAGSSRQKQRGSESVSIRSLKDQYTDSDESDCGVSAQVNPRSDGHVSGTAVPSGNTATEQTRNKLEWHTHSPKAGSVRGTARWGDYF